MERSEGPNATELGKENQYGTGDFTSIMSEWFHVI